MPLVKAGQIVEDQYVRVEDDAPLPDGVPVLLTAARFLADARDLVERDAPVGVIWPNDRRVTELAPWIDRLALIALVFPKFKDGRAYSQARLLRERYAFRGELRATGEVLRDQFQFLLRSGFDAFEVKNRPTPRCSSRPPRASRSSINRAPTAACLRFAAGCRAASPCHGLSAAKPGNER